MTEPEHARLEWHKSSASAGGGDCVEVAIGPQSIYVRHSRHAEDEPLAFRYEEWAAFLTGVRNGEFGLPPAAQTTPGD